MVAPNIFIFGIILLGFLLGLCIAEFFLAKKQWTYGLILPITFTVIAILVDRIILIPVLMLVIAFVIALAVRKGQDKKRTEMEKMHIQDL